MKTFNLTLLALCIATVIQAQSPDDPGLAPRLTRGELKELVGPIALYPDPLVALILPASTDPSDIVLAARFVSSGEDLALVANKPWDASLKALTRYPDTLRWLDENLEWTSQLGDAYTAQPADVMDAIQELRGQAQSLGNLADTPEQQVIHDDDYIRIVPANPRYIYVPNYEPRFVFFERPVREPFLWFGSGYECGPWLTYDFDWHRRRLYCGEWRDGDYAWDYNRHHHHDHDQVVFINDRFNNFHVWNRDHARHVAPSHHFAERRDDNSGRRVVAAPTAFANVVHKTETIRRATLSDAPPSKPGAFKGPHDGRNNGDEHNKGHFVMPKNSAPNVSVNDRQPGSNKPHGDSNEVHHATPFHPGEAAVIGNSKPHGDMTKPHGDGPASHGDSPKPHTDLPKVHSNNIDQPRPHGDSPKPHTDLPKVHSNNVDQPRPHNNSPKPHSDPPKPHNDAPKPHADSGKPHGDKPHGDMPQKHDASKANAPQSKPHTDAPKPHSGSSNDDKKKKDDKKH